MKILFLNVWNAKLEEPLVAYLKEEMRDTDVFCFQEFFDEAYEYIHHLLNDFECVHARKEIDTTHVCGQSTYVRKNVTRVSSWTQLEHEMDIGLALWVHVKVDDRSIHICNYHGHALPGDKQDTRERVVASESLLNTAESLEGTIIIGGDFNLNTDTHSVGIFSKNGYTNLIEAYAIDTTRNKHAWIYPIKLHHSDYVFVRDSTVESFSVPKNEVSDHLPLIVRV